MASVFATQHSDGMQGLHKKVCIFFSQSNLEVQILHLQHMLFEIALEILCITFPVGVLSAHRWIT